MLSELQETVSQSGDLYEQKKKKGLIRQSRSVFLACKKVKRSSGWSISKKLYIAHEPSNGPCKWTQSGLKFHI